MTTTTRRMLRGDEPRRLNIVYIRSSKSVRRRFLFLGSTRERVSAGSRAVTLSVVAAAAAAAAATAAAMQKYQRKGEGAISR